MIHLTFEKKKKKQKKTKKKTKKKKKKKKQKQKKQYYKSNINHVLCKNSSSFDHTTMKAPDPIRTPKLSIVGSC